jgi:hypothetical protein
LLAARTCEQAIKALWAADAGMQQALASSNARARPASIIKDSLC